MVWKLRRQECPTPTSDRNPPIRTIEMKTKKAFDHFLSLTNEGIQRVTCSHNPIFQKY